MANANGSAVPNANIPNFTGASSGAAGRRGLVPAPTAGQQTLFLRGDGTWSDAGAGTVTSVGLSMPSIFTVSGSPVTGAGTLTAALNTQTANLIFAGPSSGSAAAPTFRAVASADLTTALTTPPPIGGTTPAAGTFTTLTDTVEIINGTGGAGYLQIANQSSAPSTPTTSGRIYFDASNRFSWIGTNGFTRTFDGTANTANRIYVLPDAAGTIALTSDITTATALAVILAPASSTRNVVQATGDYVPLILKRQSSGQTANLLSIVNELDVPQAYINSQGSIFVAGTHADPVTPYYTFASLGTLTISGNANIDTRAFKAAPQYDPGGFTWTGQQEAFDAQPVVIGSGTLSDFRGYNVVLGVSGTATVTNARGITIGPATIAGGGAITNLYGLFISSQTVGSALNYAIYTNTGPLRFGDKIIHASGVKVTSETDSTAGLQWGNAAAATIMRMDTTNGRLGLASIGTGGAGAPAQLLNLTRGHIRFDVLSSPTAATAALAGLGAGNLSNGAYSYKVSLVAASGETTPGTVSNTVTVTDAATDGQISLTAIPTSTDTSVTSRKIYRTMAGGTLYYLLATIADNTTTTYTDNIADASLTVLAATSGNTAASFFIGSTLAMQFNGAGRVGIGTTDPQKQLGVSVSDGTAVTSTNLGTNVAGINLTNSNTGNNRFIDIAFNNSATTVSNLALFRFAGISALVTATGTTGSQGSIVFWTKLQTATTTTEAMRIDHAQNVSIGGKTTATAHLDIIGVVDAVQFLVKGFSTQTNVLTSWRDSSNAVLASVDGTGLGLFAGLSITDAKNVAIGTTTGTKIGTATTQKIGFWNVTPVIQYATTGTSTGFTAGAGTTATSLSTWTGNTGASAYTTSDIVRALKLAGIMAA